MLSNAYETVKISAQLLNGLDLSSSALLNIGGAPSYMAFFD